MNQETPTPSIHDKVLAAIKAGQVTMRPKWHYVLKGALLLTGAAIVAGALLFLTSFIIFYLRHSGVWFVPSFGWRSVPIFLTSLPWLLIAVTGIFLVILEVLVRRYAFAWRQPLLYSALAIVVLVAVGGLAVAQTPLHSGFLKQAQMHQLPLGELLYREFNLRVPPNIHPGTIKELSSEGFVLVSRRDNEEFNVLVTPQTRFPIGYDLEEGDLIVVWGEQADHTVQAFGIREIEALPGEFIPRPPFPRHFQPPMFMGR